MSINPEVFKWAKWASEKIDVPAEIIYAQWSLEAGESGIQNPAKRSYNLAGLTVSGTPGIWRKYSSLAEFASDYVYSFILPGYPQVVGTKTIDEFVRGLKFGKWGSYFGSESIESYGSKLKSRYKYLDFSAPNSSDSADGAELKHYKEPLWRKIWTNFLEKFGFKPKGSPVPPTPEEELWARKKEIEEAEKKGEQVPKKFKEYTENLESYVKKQEDEGGIRSWIENIVNKALFILIGIACIIAGVILFVKDIGLSNIIKIPVKKEA